MTLVNTILVVINEFDWKSWLIASVFGFITYWIAKFYFKVRQFPSGPTPWPILGNIIGTGKV